MDKSGILHNSDSTLFKLDGLTHVVVLNYAYVLCQLSLRSVECVRIIRLHVFCHRNIGSPTADLCET